LLFETDKHFGEDQKTLDISQYSLESSLTMSNYSFLHNSNRLPLVILNLRAFSSKCSYFILNINEELLQDEQQTNQYEYNPVQDVPKQNFIQWCKKRLSSLLEWVLPKTLLRRNILCFGT
jgi:hypothetical protein